MTTAYDLNDQITAGGMRGLEAAMDRFGDRMAQINEHKNENTRSQHFYAYAMSLAKQVDELSDVIRSQAAQLAENSVLLRQANERAATFSRISDNHASYLKLVIGRLNKVEDVLQRQSAHSFALDAFRQLALQELSDIQDPAKSLLIDPVKRQEFLDQAWDQFMNTTSVKRGVPRLGVDKP